MTRAELKRRFPLLLYSAGRTLASVLPEPALFGIAHTGGSAAARLLSNRNAAIRRTLRRAVSEERVDDAVVRAFRSYARYWVETLRLPKPGPDAIRNRTTYEGFEEMFGHLDRGRGVIFVVPHFGSWDVAGAWLASLGRRVVTVAERLKPPELFDLFVRLRAQSGMEIHPLGSPSSARALLSGLREGAVVPLLGDRDMTRSGVEVEFFGERTHLPSGPAILAARTGAPLAIGACFQRPHGRYHAVCLKPLAAPEGRAGAGQIREVTQRIATDMETIIRMDPGQWHLFQPNWPSDMR